MIGFRQQQKMIKRCEKRLKRTKTGSDRYHLRLHLQELTQRQHDQIAAHEVRRCDKLQQRAEARREQYWARRAEYWNRIERSYE